MTEFERLLNARNDAWRALRGNPSREAVAAYLRAHQQLKDYRERR